uniref:TOX high mobility group box family member 4 a n=1 Tax=Tetraodon nigroviridis TaxID=99883 RepID=H3CR67_TETNG
FYSELSAGSPSNVDSEYLNGQAYGGYSEENKFSEGNDSYLGISGQGHHPFLSAATFHTPSLGDEDFEIPPISLDPDHALNISDPVSHFELPDGSDGPSGPRSLGSDLVVQANDPSFASSFVNSGSQGLDQINLGTMGPAVGGALMSSSALELGNSAGSHFSNSSPTTIDVHLGDIGHGLLESTHLPTINQSELVLGLGTENMRQHSGASEQPLSATPSPANSLQDEEMDDFKRSVLVDPPVSLPASAAPSYLTSQSVPMSSVSPTTAKRGGAKQTAPLSVPGMAGNKKARKKKDPNEPQKPVSAYALFFRDTQAAIKGQNPSASFGEVSKIVASMWDSLAEEQKQVYKRKTEAAKKEYLKALAAYKANQLSQPITEEMETAPSSPAPAANSTPAQQAPRPPDVLEDKPVASPCGSSIILNVPELRTHFYPGADKAAAAPPAKITKIIIPKHVLQAGGQLVTVLPGGLAAFQPTLVVSGAPRQPPPLQQMQSAPPPPRLQQMAPTPPPLQAKPREGSAASVLPVSLLATSPPPLQIKIVPASIQDRDSLPIVVPDADVLLATSTSALSAQRLNPAATSAPADDVTHVLRSEEVEMEVNGSGDSTPAMSICVRAGCNNPAIESKEWDKEYCSNECVATHCRDVFEAWCSIRNQTAATVK